MDDERRAAMGCTRGDLPPVEWDVEPGALTVHLGQMRRPDEEIDPQSPDPMTRKLEDEDDGCPGGDQRCWFVRSLLHYGYRRRAEGGVRVPHPRLAQCSDDLIIDALIYFEQEQDACDAHNWQVKEDERRARS